MVDAFYASWSMAKFAYSAEGFLNFHLFEEEAASGLLGSETIADAPRFKCSVDMLLSVLRKSILYLCW